jgi:Rieske Fe-S protein
MAICPCHGSAFNADTGAVQRGPATRGLAPASVAVVDGTLQIN